MNNFDKARFGRYAKFDFTINRSFYRNLALVLLATIVGLVVILFMIRWLTFSIGVDQTTYNDLTTTAMFTVSVIMIAFHIMAGCTLHPLRNKQGRITNLTLPATNLEKYLWHLLICIGGCLAVAVVSVAVADLVNFALSALIFKSTDGVQSLFANVFYAIPDKMTYQLSFMDATMSADMNSQSFDPTYQPEPDSFLSNMMGATWAFALCLSLFEMGIYALGNALKYKFNIIITYVAMQFAGFIFAICFIIGSIIFSQHADSIDPITARNFIEHLYIYFYVLAALFAAGGIALFVWAYKLYTKAQLTNSWNK
ncbi:MAG: hypothetical protein IJ528_03265 [Bacteroidaceae bacterium]|nr:hypothetical protein [Bacteroidaceae bacterium]